MISTSRTKEVSDISLPLICSTVQVKNLFLKDPPKYQLSLRKLISSPFQILNGHFFRNFLTFMCPSHKPQHVSEIKYGNGKDEAVSAEPLAIDAHSLPSQIMCSVCLIIVHDQFNGNYKLYLHGHFNLSQTSSKLSKYHQVIQSFRPSQIFIISFLMQ